MKILIYDNLSAYYKLLKKSFFKEYQFVLINSNTVEEVDLDYDMILFFMYDEIELLDFVKLYAPEKTFVLGFSSKDAEKDLMMQGNIQFLNLKKFKNELLADIRILLEKGSINENPAC